MKRETFEKLLRMDVVKKNFFDTPHGKYQISILIDEHEDLYFVKWKNDILVEMVNLSKFSAAPRDSLQGSKRDFDEYGVDT